ncbi:MAG: DUF881 domain-containing protein [Actinobacteria bacterium]|nr:DUF881 domain-containing protein [Actinomycetota bacterium]
MLNKDSLILTLVLAILGFFVSTAVLAGRAEREQAAPRKAELVRLIENRRSLVADLDKAVEQLREDVSRAQQRANRDNVRDREAARVAEQLAQQAGTVPLRGRGLVVELAPSNRQPPSQQEAGAYQIHDGDLQLVVNALLAAGAEAVAINDSRLVATTPIRSAGGTIVVNFRPLSPPYKVHAIGADHRRFETSEIARRFRRWTNLFGLGFEVREERRVEVPAYTGRVGISSATPAPPGPRPVPEPHPSKAAGGR